jgi:hypothetical protein
MRNDDCGDPGCCPDNPKVDEEFDDLVSCAIAALEMLIMVRARRSSSVVLNEIIDRLSGAIKRHYEPGPQDKSSLGRVKE